MLDVFQAPQVPQEKFISVISVYLQLRQEQGIEYCNLMDRGPSSLMLPGLPAAAAPAFAISVSAEQIPSLIRDESHRWNSIPPNDFARFSHHT